MNATREEIKASILAMLENLIEEEGVRRLRVRMETNTGAKFDLRIPVPPKREAR